jgi:twitching motility two-component system response regulator PilG
MSATKHFSVGVLGFPELERQILQRIFSLSATRPRTYRMLVEPETEPVDIVLVDRMNLVAAGKARASAGSGTPVIGVIDGSDPEERYWVRRPLTATRTLGMLDRVVEIEILNHDSEAQTRKPQSTGEAPMAAADAKAPVQASAPPTPRTKTPHEARQPPPRPARSGAPRKKYVNSGYRALVVDDSLPVRKQVALALERSGISADFAENGEAALDLIAKNDYEIIFLDVIMPGVDGYEVCKSIKRDKQKKNIPVVMLTGKSSPFDKVKGKLSGCDTYLTKPVSIREFNSTLNKCLKAPMAFQSMAGLN